MKILLHRRAGGLGDVLCTLPAVGGLREKFPRARITYALDPYFVPLLEGNPDVDFVLEIDNRIGRRGLRQLQKKFDGVYDLYCPAGEYERRVRWKVEKSRIENFVEFVDAWPASFLPFYQIKRKEARWARDWLKANDLDGRALVGMQWKTARVTKDYPFLREVAGAFLKEGLGVLLLVKDRIEQLPDGAVVAAGFGLREVGALIGECDLLTGADSGLLHFAASVGTPALGLFGPTNPETTLRFYPLSDFLWQLEAAKEVGCQMPCYYASERGFKCLGVGRCMQAIWPESVVKRALEMLGI